MEVEITERTTIKPSIPTSDGLRSVELSFLDQLSPITYTPLVLFYHSTRHQAKTSELLKSSLSKTLTQFYPLAGRIKDNILVECADYGAEYVEARIKSLLSEFLKHPEPKELNKILPATIESSEAATGCLLLAQASFFDCSGLALAVCISHKVADAATLSSFIKRWAANASNFTEFSSPEFIGASIFPPAVEFSTTLEPSSLVLKQQKCVTKRFVFDAPKLAALKARVSSAMVSKPTRVESVSALIWKCIITASKPKLKPSVWVISVNLRKRMVPPLPENYAGNCVGFIVARAEDSEAELQSLVSKIRKELDEFGEKFVKRVQGEGCSSGISGLVEEFGELAASNKVEIYSCASWCKYGLYEADFGWGEPIWLSSATMPYKNAVILMDTRDGDGIEAWITLSEEDMASVESDQELLEFAALNPTVSLV